MLDDLLGQILGEAVFGRLGESERAKARLRVGFGLLGTALGVAGALHFALLDQPVTNAAMLASMIAVFVFLAAFFLFNVALHRPWRWPGLGFVVSFVALFATRILLGP